VAFSAAERRRAEQIAGQYPQARSATLPLLHMVQERDGWVTPQGIEDVAEFLSLTPALVLGTCSFYTMFKTGPVGRLVVSVCTNIACLVNGGPELYEHLRREYLSAPDVHVEEVECLAACDLAPVLQINYEFHGPLTGETAVALIERYRAGELKARTISGTAPGGGD
jgi:NADH:ubiquinone oxidoreductase subunit E